MRKPMTAPASPPQNLKWLGGLIFLIGLAYGRLLLHPRPSQRLPRKRHMEPADPLVGPVLRDGHLPLSPLGFRHSLAGHLANRKFLSRHPSLYLAGPFRLEFFRDTPFIDSFIRRLLFLRNGGVHPFWAFHSLIALLNGCAYNHLGSNSSMDTMSWIPLAAPGRAPNS